MTRIEEIREYVRHLKAIYSSTVLEIEYFEYLLSEVERLEKENQLMKGEGRSTEMYAKLYCENGELEAKVKELKEAINYLEEHSKDIDLEGQYACVDFDALMRLYNLIKK